MSLFFIGLNPRYQMYRFLPQNLNMMFSASSYWDEDENDWRRPIKKFPKKSGKKWFDCGGFLVLNRWGDYPFSTINYANLIILMRPDYFATQDYPCEPEISRMLGLMTNHERIQATVEKAIELVEWEDHLPGKMVPVIQGYSLEEYQYCIDLYRQAGLIRDYMAVGSMCRRISTEEINRLIPGIYHAAKKAGCKRLHFFGLKLSPDLELLSRYIYSRDSAVAMDDYDPELRKARGGRRYPKGQKEKKLVFESFLGRLDNLGLSYA